MPVVKQPCKTIARRLDELGVSANHVSIVGFIFGILCVASIAFGHFGFGLFLLLINRIADGVDGELARLTSATDAGAYLDICLDFTFYALFPVGFALYDPVSNALPAAILICSFVGTGSSFLAFSVFAKQRGIEHPDFSYKGLYYLNGITEGTETIIIFVLMCLFYTLFPVLALIFAILCLITAGSRIYFCFSTLNNQ